jgi:hypothetical protein
MKNKKPIMASKAIEKSTKLALLAIALVLSFFIIQKQIWKVLATPSSKDFDCAQQRIDEKLSETEQKETKANWEKALSTMRDTNTSLITLAILIIGGTLGLPLAKKLVPIGDKNFFLILLPPSWLFLIYSLKMGFLFKQRLSHELMLGVFYPLSRCLNDPFQLQLKFFEWGLIVLVIFISSYMIFIIAGGTSNGKPKESNPKDGDNR